MIFSVPPIRGRRNDMGYVEECSNLFLHGVRLYKSNLPLVIPIPLIILFGTTVCMSMVAEGIFNYHKTDWLQLCINLIFTPISVLCGVLITVHKKNFTKVSKEIDRWWNYSFLFDETAEIKKQFLIWIDWYGYYYYRVMYFSFVMNLVPLLKRYLLGKSEDPMNNLMYPCWTPFDLETEIGFIVTYTFQLVALYMSYFSFGNMCFHLTAAYVSLGYQAKLIGTAMLTLEERCQKKLKADGVKFSKSHYDSSLEKEIISCIKHYQKLQSCAADLRHIYSAIADLCYDVGMLVVSLSGLKIATETDKIMIVNSFMNTGITLANQFIVSFICEILTEEVMVLRNTIYRSNWLNMPVPCRKYIYTFQMMVDHMPTLVTALGTKINFENFSKVLNTSYCYFSLILSMRNK